MKEPRYYQRTAINRSVEAILRGDKRLLLTLATGTGKTFVSMQIVWKLWKSGWRGKRNPRILYLADRNILVDQPIEREYKPAFGTGDNTPIWKLQGEAKAGREIYFALYQALADSGDDLNGMFREFAPDFFDLVIVDECHRGSARSESSWRAILEHFAPATQLGMTATPKRDETIVSYETSRVAPVRVTGPLAAQTCADSRLLARDQAASVVGGGLMSWASHCRVGSESDIGSDGGW